MTTNEMRTALQEHAAEERECLEQAKAELEFSENSGAAFCMRLLTRAQEIKQERKGKK